SAATPSDESPRRGGTLRILSVEPDHILSTSTYQAGAVPLMRATTRQLVAYPYVRDLSDHSVLVPDVARAVPTVQNRGLSPDRMTYTFHLRRGVRWNSSPPRDVVAGDFVRAIKLLCNPVVPTGNLNVFLDIDGLPRFCDDFAKTTSSVDEIRRFVAEHE